ncbi:nucleotidyltransferase domain-containing protein [Candidatus Microgenomates bacterium]|nr:nucleotidyltransferase domain-containing protein [Candidatus Microgenomates bacterium]
MVSKKAKKIISVYKNSLEKKVKIDKLILFGSWARGKQTKESDLDLLVISPDFNKLSDKKRFSLLWDARNNPLTRKIDMDILGLTPEEFSQASPLTTLGEIKETGIEV